MAVTEEGKRLAEIQATEAVSDDSNANLFFSFSFFFFFFFFFTIGPAPLLKMIKQHEMSFPDCTLCMNQHQNPVYRILWS